MGLLDRLRQVRLRRRMEHALGQALEAPSSRTLASLLDSLTEGGERDPIRSVYVVEQLGGASEVAVDLLAEVVVDERWPALARTQALRVLARKQRPAVLRLSARMIEHEDPVRRSLLAEALGCLEEPAAIPYLERLLTDDSECAHMWGQWRVMDDAARSLVRWRNRCTTYGVWVKARLDELEGEGRDAAAISLGFVKHDAAIPALVRAGVGGDWWALDLLEMYQSREVSEALCSALPNADESVQAAVAQALGKNGDPSCIPALAAILAGSSALARFAAARGLRWLEHEDARRVLAIYRDDHDPEIRNEVRLAEQPAE